MKYVGYFLVFAAIVAFMGMCGSGFKFSGRTSPTDPEITVEDLDEHTAWAVTERHAYDISKQCVLAKLKSPRSAIFGEHAKAEQSGDMWRVSSTVDSKNPMGVELRSQFTALINYRGGDPADGSSWECVGVEFE